MKNRKPEETDSVTLYKFEEYATPHHFMSRGPKLSENGWELHSFQVANRPNGTNFIAAVWTKDRSKLFADLDNTDENIERSARNATESE